MLQVFASVLFSLIAVSAVGIIAALLHADWPAFTTALGFGMKAPTLPVAREPRIRIGHARSAKVIRLEVPGSRTRAVA